MKSESRSWIIRYPNYTFSRPMDEAELLKLFESGEMQPQNEICAGNGYWFSLQDVKEMRNHFGNMPMDGLFKKANEEVTQERYAVTKPIVVPAQMKESLKSTPNPALNPSPASRVSHTSPVREESIQKTSPLMKILLAGLTLLVAVLLFVWFG